MLFDIQTKKSYAGPKHTKVIYMDIVIYINYALRRKCRIRSSMNMKSKFVTWIHNILSTDGIQIECASDDTRVLSNILSRYPCSKTNRFITYQDDYKAVAMMTFQWMIKRVKEWKKHTELLNHLGLLSHRGVIENSSDCAATMFVLISDIHTIKTYQLFLRLKVETTTFNLY